MPSGEAYRRVLDFKHGRRVCYVRCGRRLCVMSGVMGEFVPYVWVRATPAGTVQTCVASVFWSPIF